MSDEIKGAVGEMKGAAALEPILDGVEKIANQAIATEKRITEKTDHLETEVGRIKEDMTNKINELGNDLVDRMERVQKAVGPQARLGLITDVTEPLQAVATDLTKSYLARAPFVCRDVPKESPLSTPIGGAAMIEWLYHASIMGQLKKHPLHAESGARLEKLTQAFNEISPAGLQKQIDGVTDVAGGYLIPTVTAAEILRKMLDFGKVFPAGRQVMMTARREEYPDEATNVQTGWKVESQAMGSGQEPTFGQKVLQAELLYSTSKLSQEIEQDSAPNLLGYLLDVKTEAMARVLDQQVMEGAGAGVGSNDPFVGINNAANVNDTTVGGVNGDPLTYQQLVDTYVAGGEDYTREDGVWIMSPRAYGFALGLVDSQGQPIVKLGTVENAPAGTILGRPIIVSSVMTTFTVGSGTASNIYFGPLRDILCGTRLAMNWDVTDQVSWSNYQLDTRLIGRFAIVVGVAQSWTKLTGIVP